MRFLISFGATASSIFLVLNGEATTGLCHSVFEITKDPFGGNSDLIKFPSLTFQVEITFADGKRFLFLKG